MATKYYTDDEIAAARAARNAPGNHYSDGRRFSRINNAWIFVEDWNDAEEIATLRAEIERLHSSNEALREALTYLRNQFIWMRVECSMKQLDMEHLRDRAEAALLNATKGEGK
jgi:quinol monooxygenase YgiN